MTWKSDINKWQIPDTLVTGEAVVNPCARKWHEKYAQALHNANMQPIFGVSFEMYSLAANEFWAQRDWNSNLGKTGYQPPSYFFSLSDQNALAYLHKVLLSSQIQWLLAAVMLTCKLVNLGGGITRTRTYLVCMTIQQN